MKLFNFLNSDSGKKKRSKKILFPALVAALLLFFISTHFAHATVASSIAAAFGDIGYYVIGKIAFGISFIIAWIAGVAIGIMAWLVSVMLGINTGVFQSAAVQIGYGVSLAIANLGFVLGIIIIAIATILRRETYGIKKILWKLIAAAILVNFSLVIIAPIFNFSNVVTQYFLNCIDPTTGCNPASSNGLVSTTNFATRLAGSFNPQSGFSFASSTNATALATDPNAQGAFATVGGSVGKMLVPIFSIAFVMLESIAVIIVLTTFVFMLLIRYLYIVILAILMPFAWLCWVFPNLSSHWDKWWKEFIRWTLFAPISIFFLYLAIVTLNAMSQAGSIGSQSFATYTSSSNVIWGSISSFFTSVFTPIIQNALNMIVMLGLSVAGLIVANSMSITGAKEGLGAAKGAGKAFGTYVGKRTARGAASAAARVANPRPLGSGPSRNAFTARLKGIASYVPNALLNNRLLNNPTVNPYRTTAQTGLQNVAQSPSLKTPAWNPKMGQFGLASSLWKGATGGSGVFKKAGVKDWECQNCPNATPPQLPAKVIRSKQKPTIACSQCHANATLANWTEI